MCSLEKFGMRKRSAHTTAYEASGSSGTARQEGVAVSLVYIGEIECAPPPAAVAPPTIVRAGVACAAVTPAPVAPATVACRRCL